jgi:hypothetical protein
VETEERLVKIYDQLLSLIAFGNATYQGMKQGKNLISQGMYAGAYASFYLIQGQKCKDKYEMLCWKVDDEEGQVFNFWHQLDDQNLKDIY